MACVVALAALRRLSAHPSFYFDGEASIPATIGRELWLHGADLVFHYNLIPYQGSLVVDPVLSSLAYRAIGDHALAWYAIPIAYLALASWAGSDLLARAVGSVAAVAWPVLLMTLPFFIQDGWVRGVGGHPAAATWGLAATALAARADRDARWAFAGGFLLAFGAWHVRSAAIATPALLLAAATGGWRGLRAAGAGLLGFPLLVGAHAVVLLRTGTFWDTMAPSNLLNLMLRPAAQASEHGFTTHVGLANGWLAAPAMFLQPASPDGPTMRPGWLLSGRIWAAAWLAALPAALLAWRSRDRGLADLRIAAALTLPLTWGLFILLSRHGVDDALPREMRNLRPQMDALPLNASTYLTPVYSLYVFGLALAAGLVAGTRARWVAVPMLVVPIAIGAFHAVGDQGEREETQIGEVDAWFYPGIQLTGRVPPDAVHRRSVGRDPDSDAYHLEAWASMLHHGGELITSDPSGQAAALQEAIDGGALTDEASEVLARALGRNLGGEAAGVDEERLGELARGMLAVATELPYPLDMEYVTGFVQPLDPSVAGSDPAGWLTRLCQLPGVEPAPAVCR
ncbi:MAG: hypothetical protein GY898_09185 [Proteobacteria bacterium]|nr:hypothetical protein [Pseudomonadota bacterium]